MPDAARCQFEVVSFEPGLRGRVVHGLPELEYDAA
jgi:hypothetical protein